MNSIVSTSTPTATPPQASPPPPTSTPTTTPPQASLPLPPPPPPQASTSESKSSMVPAVARTTKPLTETFISEVSLSLSAIALLLLCYIIYCLLIYVSVSTISHFGQPIGLLVVFSSVIIFQVFYVALNDYFYPNPRAPHHVDATKSTDTAPPTTSLIQQTPISQIPVEKKNESTNIEKAGGKSRRSRRSRRYIGRTKRKNRC